MDLDEILNTSDAVIAKALKKWKIDKFCLRDSTRIDRLAFYATFQSGSDLSVLKKGKRMNQPKRNKIVQTATTDYRNSECPILGIPLQIVQNHILPHLSNVDVAQLSATCRRFFHFGTNGIAEHFRVLAYQGLTLINNRSWKTKSLVYLKEQREIIDSGKGVTELAVTEFKRFVLKLKSLSMYRDEKSMSERKHIYCEMRKMLDMIRRFGSYDRFKAHRSLLREVQIFRTRFRRRNLDILMQKLKDEGKHFVSTKASGARICVRQNPVNGSEHCDYDDFVLCYKKGYDDVVVGVPLLEYFHWIKEFVMYGVEPQFDRLPKMADRGVMCGPDFYILNDGNWNPHADVSPLEDRKTSVKRERDDDHEKCIFCEGDKCILRKKQC